jgi:uncharacterized membrane protein YjfL (UPF0719 family)
MFRTIFGVGALAILGVLALKLTFGLFGSFLGGLIALLMWAVFAALKIALVALLVYFIIKLVSPDTARRIRERWSGGGGTSA